MIEYLARLPVRVAALCSLALPLAAPALALPDDAQQPIETTFTDFEGQFDNTGLLTLYGSATEPASVRQGSMLITGMMIRLERDGETITRVTTTGMPARFQQQLAVDQAPLQASGLTLVFDNTAQVLTIEEQVELVQADGSLTNAHYFEYDLTTRRFKASRDPSGEQARMVLPPPQEQQ